MRAPIGNKHWHAGPDADAEAYRVKAEAMQGLHVSLSAAVVQALSRASYVHKACGVVPSVMSNPG